MRREIGAVVGAAVLAATVLRAGAQEAVPPTAEELAAISDRGKLLYEYDQAIWHATDAVEMANPKTVEGQRSIARKLHDKWMVVFGKLNEERNRFGISYQANEQGSLRQFAVEKEQEERQDEGFFLYAARAIEVASNDFGAVHRPYNIAVLLDRAEQLYVYLYPAQMTAGVYPLGGDARYLVSADGKKILGKREMHKAILDVARRPGRNVASGFHTHLLSDLVEDTDVFHVLTEDPPIPEFIATQHFRYQVKTDGTIQLEKEKKRRK